MPTALPPKIDVQTIPLLALPFLPFGERRRLPRCPAIYFVLNAAGTVLYIGQSLNLAQRWATHHRAATLLEHQATRIAWLTMDDTTLLDAVEAACIAYFAPLCNGVPGSVGPTKKRGPRPRGYVNVHLYMPPDLLEWAKNQPEGFAALCRVLVEQERQRRERTA